VDRPQLAAVLAHEAPFQPTVLQKDKLIPGGTKTKGYLIDVFMVLSRQW
jgi:hypothetical protein